MMLSNRKYVVSNLFAGNKKFRISLRCSAWCLLLQGFVNMPLNAYMWRAISRVIAGFRLAGWL
jgi:hypothetical protein